MNIYYKCMVVCLKFCPIVCGGSVFGICFVLLYLVSFLVLQSSSRGKESWLIALIVVTVSVPLFFLGWSAACDCQIS